MKENNDVIFKWTQLLTGYTSLLGPALLLKPSQI